MGKAKKKKKKGKGVKKEKKSRAHVDERVKKILELQPPDKNPYKMDNEKSIDRFWRFKGKSKKDRMTIRQLRKLRH